MDYNGIHGLHILISLCVPQSQLKPCRFMLLSMTNLELITISLKLCTSSNKYPTHSMQTGPGVLLICRMAVVIAYSPVGEGPRRISYFPPEMETNTWLPSGNQTWTWTIHEYPLIHGGFNRHFHLSMGEFPCLITGNWCLNHTTQTMRRNAGDPGGLILRLQHNVDDLHELSAFPLLL